MPYVRPYQRRREFFGNGNAPTVNGGDRPPVDLVDAVEKFKKHVLRGRAGSSTVDHYETILKHDLDLPNGWPITTTVLEQWRDYQLKLADATQYARWNITRQFVTWLMRQYERAGQPIGDPMEDIPRPERPKPHPYRRTATEDEITALLRACKKDDWWDHRLWVMIQLLRNTGLRSGEAVKLRWRHIKWNSPVLGEAEITIEPEDPDGEDERKRRAQKNPDADNFAHMTEPAFSALRNWHKRLCRDGMDEDDQWVFPVTAARGFIKDGRPIKYRSGHWHQNHVWQVFSMLSIRARLTRPIYPHMLRHTAGTEFACKTGDLEATRIFMRHADYTMVKAYLAPQKMREHMMAQHRKVRAG